MAAPVNANINVLIDTKQAMGQLRSLQAQIAATNKSINAGSGAAAAQQAALSKALMDSANSSRMWNARIIPMTTATQQFTEALDKGKMSLGQYSRYAASQLPGMSRVFKREFDMMNRVAEQNVRRMQTQFVALGNSANGAAQAMAFTPTALNKQAAATQMAVQRQMMMNRMIDLGSTKLLNWGKNTQWAGRQLMVGFSIPLAMMGAAAAKAFKEIDQGSIAFKRVYGNLETTTAEMERNLDAVKELGLEYTKYGKSLASTIDLASRVAATGAQNETLIAATEQTIRLATLGLMEYDEALQATIALQTAFNVSNEDLTSTIDFLNVVENETILTMQDMAAAIPRVAPVIKGLGGDVKDLAVFMTAMREGGVTAEQGANALKSGLGRLINPTKAAREEMAKYGISIDSITQKNKGDLMGTLNEFGRALATLGDFEQQQVLQKVFGTYQYARLGALFKNLANDSSQAQRTIELTSMSVEDLASISERELSKIEEATSTKFQAAIEQLKVSIAPIGETFMKALMPIIDFITKIANSFNDLPSGIKNAIAIAVGAIAGIGPVVLMTVGLIANGMANMVKLVQTIRKFLARLKGDSKAFGYLTSQEQEARMAADGLSGSTQTLTNKFLGQAQALERLIQLVGTYGKALTTIPGAAAVASAPAAAAPARTPVGVIPPAYAAMAFKYKPQRFARGGTVPGSGNKDTVPALLTPGETVINKKASQQFRPIIDAMNSGNIKLLAQGSQAQTRTLPMAAGGIPISFDARSSQRIENVLTRLNAWLAEGNSLDQQQVAQLRQLITSQKMTGDKLKEALRTVTGQEDKFSARGERRTEGAGRTSAPPEIRSQTTRFAATDPRIQEERRMLERQFGPRGVTPLTSGQFKNIGGLEASHIRRVAPGMDKWAGQALNLNPEFGAIQKYLERIQLSHATWSKNTLVLNALMDEFNGDLTKVNAQMELLKQGVAPLDEDAHRAHRAFARLDLALSQAALEAGVHPTRGKTALGTVPGTALSTAGPAAFLADKRLSGASSYFASGGGNLRYAPVATSQAAAVTSGVPNLIAAEQAAATAGANTFVNTHQSVLNSKAPKIYPEFIHATGHTAHPGFGKAAVDDANLYVKTLKAALSSSTPFQQSVLPNKQQFSQSLRNALGTTGNLQMSRTPNPLSNVVPVSRAMTKAGVEAVRTISQSSKALTAAGQTMVTQTKPLFGQLGQSFKAVALPLVQDFRRMKSTQGNATRKGIMNQAGVAGLRGGGPTNMITGVAPRDFLTNMRGISYQLGNFMFDLKRINKNFPAVKAEWQKQVPQLRTAFSEVMNGLKSSGKVAAKDLATIWRQSGMVTQIKAAGQGVVKAYYDTRQAIGAAGSAVANAVRGVGNKISQAAAGIKGFFAGGVNESGQSRGQRMAGMGNTAVMGLMGLSMAASFAGGEVGELAQKIMPVTMGLMGLQMILPMLTNPMGLAIIAIGALTAAIIKTRMDLDNLARESARAGANIGGVANSLKILEEATGFKAPDPKDRLFRFTDEDREAMGQFSSYFESEAGSKFIEELNKVTSEERYQKVAYMLAQGIASGMDEDKAKAFGMAIAEATGDTLLNSRLIRDFANQVFKAGSQALVELESNRFSQAPGIRNVGRLQGYVESMPTAQNAGLVTTEGYFQRVLRSVNIFKTFGDFFLGNAEKFSDVEQASRGLGFALEASRNLANVEAVIAEERRNGLITATEYAERQAEVNDLQRRQSDYIKRIFSVGADSGALSQALKEQLTLQGFNEEQRSLISERVDPEQLAQRFFNTSYADLEATQKTYVEEVFTRILSGITPENVTQRLADIEGTYTEIANRAAEAMLNGILDIDSLFNTQEFSEAIRSALNVETGFTSAETGKTIWDSDILAQNLEDANEKLLEFNTDSQEVLMTLLKFEDVKFAASLLENEEDILRVGSAIQKLAEYEDINIEMVLKEGFSPQDILDAIEKINNIKFDKKIFGNAVVDADLLVQKMIDLGYEANDIPGMVTEGVAEATSEIDQLTKDAFNKFGDIKITPNTLFKLFDTEYASKPGFVSAIESVFPNELPTATLPILLQILNPEQIAALAELSPDAAAFLMKNPEATSYNPAPGVSGVPSVAFTPQAQSAAAAIGLVSSLGLGETGSKTAKTPKDSSTSGSAEKSWLEQTRETLEANAALYLTTKRAMDKYGKDKANFFGVFQELRNRFKLPEGFIESLGTGPEAIARATEFLKATKAERKSLIALYREVSVGEQIEKLRRDREARKTRTKAIEILAANGISKEDAEKAADDSDLAIAIVEAATKGNKKRLKNLLGLIKTEVIDPEGSNPFTQATEAQRNYYDKEMAFFEKQFADIERVAQETFEARTGMSVAGMELEIRKNEDLIDGHRERIETINDEIRAIETRNGVASNYSDWGLEQLQKELEMNQRNIAALERQNELTQRKIDALKRQDEIRLRESDALSHELEAMSLIEEKIRETYDERISALDKIAQINDHISSQQKQQLDLSRALSEGDIYAAAAAAQDMGASSAAFASTQAREALQQGMQNQIDSLTTSTGLTRDQAEQRIATLKEQSYQTSLLIRNLEDEIYNRQVNEILPLKDKEYNLNLALQKVQDSIAEKQLQIRDIERTKIEPIEKQNSLYREQVDDLLLDVEKEQAKVKNAAGQTREELERQNSWIMASLSNSELMTKETGNAESAARGLAAQWKNVGKQINNAMNALKGEYKEIDLLAVSGTITDEERQKRKDAAYSRYVAEVSKWLGTVPNVNPAEFIENKNAGGVVLGNGSRDSVAAMLSPGEFVVRKAMVNKYGLGMLQKLNQGAFSMPRYGVSSVNAQMSSPKSGGSMAVTAPVYNTYSINVPVNQPNASADEIANKVMMKIRNMENVPIRRMNGYQSR